MAVTKESLDELSKLISCKLEKYLDKKGGIIYSSHETICRDEEVEVYLIGLNPGGTGSSVTLDQCRVGNMTRTDNAYLHEEWGNFKAGEAPLQKRVQWLLKQLGLEIEKVFATNLVFMQSRKVATFKEDVGIDIKVAADACWPVHEAFLNIVRPRLILAISNGKQDFSTYSYMLNTCKEIKQVPTIHSYHTFHLKGFHTSISGQNVFVAGLPHLSHYIPNANDKTINWIKSHWTPENKQA